MSKRMSIHDEVVRGSIMAALKHTYVSLISTELRTFIETEGKFLTMKTPELRRNLS